MTLDEFLRTLETLIDDRELNDADEPGEGNFGCEDCRKCNHCRFCIGCDSCSDCTYCEESIDCTSCTQSKRCVSCEKVSYCEDCRDCKSSRYLTLCVDCTDCVHCLGCVGLDGAEFYVLNEKRTRKEYFALLRQVQELMQDRMAVGWRPPAIGLASDIDDPHVAGRDVELSAAPWLGPSEPEPAPAPRFAVRDDYGARERDWPDPRQDPRDDRGRERPGRAPVEPRWREPVASEPERGRRDAYADEYPEPDYEPSRRAREPRRVEREELDDRRPPARGYAARQPDEPGVREPARGRERYPERYPGAEREPARRREADYEPAPPAARAPARADVDPRAVGRRVERQEDWDDRPITREFNWEDSRERTVARPRRDHELREPASPIDDDDDPLLDPHEDDDDAPDDRDHEPSSPWLDEDAQARRRAKRGSLRRAGRPKRKPDGDPPRESTGSASYRTGSAPGRTGSAPGRTGSEGTHTGTGLRLGRKPKR